MSTEIPERVTAEDVAEFLTSGDNDFTEALDGWPCMSAVGNVVHIRVEPAKETPWGCAADRENAVHFRAVVVEGQTPPIVLEEPAELGMSWPDGGDLLALGPDGVAFYPRGVDEWQMDPDEALEIAAQLAAMAYARKAAFPALADQGETQTGGEA